MILTLSALWPTRLPLGSILMLWRGILVDSGGNLVGSVAVDSAIELPENRDSLKNGVFVERFSEGKTK